MVTSYKIKLPESFTAMTDKIRDGTLEIQQLIESGEFRDSTVTRYQLKAALHLISTYCSVAEEILDDERESLLIYDN